MGRARRDKRMGRGGEGGGDMGGEGRGERLLYALACTSEYNRNTKQCCYIATVAEQYIEQAT